MAKSSFEDDMQNFRSFFWNRKIKKKMPLGLGLNFQRSELPRSMAVRGRPGG